MAYTTIDNPAEHFVTTIWTGDGGDRTITGLEFKPDLIWSKTRNKTYNHMISDSSRGFNANSEIGSHSYAIEGAFSAETYGYKSGHTSDGWTMVDGTDTNDDQEDGNTNEPSVTYVAWSWKANGGTRTTNTESGNNPAGGYQANTTAGFSIVDYTGTGGAGTMAHGLGAVPKLIMVKNRSAATDWMVYHASNTAAPETDYLTLNENNATADASTMWNDTAPTSTVFSLGTHDRTNDDSETLVAYLWTDIQGYSKSGSYTGNGDADGPFIYTGFKPAFVMAKISSTTSDWIIIDNKRSAFNLSDDRLRPNSTAVEDTAVPFCDFLSNGFKNRSNTDFNADGVTTIYMAFAENPFVTSGGVPCTAH